MEQKIKFIIIGLISILVISFFISLQIYNSKRAIEQEKEILKKENMSLAAKIDETGKDIQGLKDRNNSLGRDLETVSQEKEEIQKKYELVNKEREELVEQLKTLKAQAQKAPPASQVEVVPVPLTEDSYWAGVLKAKKDLEVQLESIRNELKAVQIKSEDLARNKATLELEVNSLTQETQDLKRQIEYNQKTMDSLSQDLVREKDDNLQTQNSLRAVRSENNLLKQQLKTLNNHKFNLEKKLLETEKQNAALGDKIAGMDALLKDKALQIDKMKEGLEEKQGAGISAEEKKEVKEQGQETQERRGESVELPPIIVRPQAENASPRTAALTGKVVSLNKENNFVVIDLGENAGVKAGQLFRVYRQGQNIATLEVIQARQAISACDIKKQTAPINIGDIVK